MKFKLSIDTYTQVQIGDTLILDNDGNRFKGEIIKVNIGDSEIRLRISIIDSPYGSDIGREMDFLFDNLLLKENINWYVKKKLTPLQQEISKNYEV